jgi:hypothetical protein
MSIKVTTQVWQGSRQRSGKLLALLALADHADDQGKAWPGVPLLARKTRLSERHIRRCLNQLVASGDLEVLGEPAPSGGPWYQIRLDQLGSDNLSAETSAAESVAPASARTDSGDTVYIKEPSNKPSEQPSSKINVNHSNPRNLREKKRLETPDSLGLVSPSKNGF